MYSSGLKRKLKIVSLAMLAVDVWDAILLPFRSRMLPLYARRNWKAPPMYPSPELIPCYPIFDLTKDFISLEELKLRSGVELPDDGNDI